MTSSRLEEVIQLPFLSLCVSLSFSDSVSLSVSLCTPRALSCHLRSLALSRLPCWEHHTETERDVPGPPAAKVMNLNEPVCETSPSFDL